jgi:hypothetical protein
MAFLRFAMASAMQRMGEWSFNSRVVTLSKVNTVPARTRFKETSGRRAENRTLILGISFDTKKQILPNTLHIARPEKQSHWNSTRVFSSPGILYLFDRRQDLWNSIGEGTTRADCDRWRSLDRALSCPCSRNCPPRRSSGKGARSRLHIPKAAFRGASSSDCVFPWQIGGRSYADSCRTTIS